MESGEVNIGEVQILRADDLITYAKKKTIFKIRLSGE
jgi:hypothetical protein